MCTGLITSRRGLSLVGGDDYALTLCAMIVSCYVVLRGRVAHTLMPISRDLTLLLWIGSDLPPLKYGSKIRSKFGEYISLVPKNLRYIVNDVFEPMHVKSSHSSQRITVGRDGGGYADRDKDAVLINSKSDSATSVTNSRPSKSATNIRINKSATLQHGPTRAARDARTDNRQATAGALSSDRTAAVCVDMRSKQP